MPNRAVAIIPQMAPNRGNDESGLRRRRGETDNGEWQPTSSEYAGECFPQASPEFAIALRAVCPPGFAELFQLLFIRRARRRDASDPRGLFRPVGGIRFEERGRLVRPTVL